MKVSTVGVGVIRDSTVSYIIILCTFIKLVQECLDRTCTVNLKMMVAVLTEERKRERERERGGGGGGGEID